MGFWDFLFGQQIRVEDDFFGSLLFVDCQSPDLDYFEGARLFGPTNTVVELAITASRAGPTAAQKEFYRQVEESYPTLIPALQQEARHWLPPGGIQDFAREFWPVHLTLPAIAAELAQVEWEIAFETLHDKNHLFTLSMKGLVPYRVHVDG